MALHRFLNNFTSGEWTPLLDGRADLEQYDNAARIMENWRPMQYGGARFRTGTAFVVPAKFGNRKCRLLPFNFSTATRFILEFGHEYVRFITNGEQVMEAEKTITAMTAADPAVFTSTAHGFSDGDEVELNTLVGPVALNGRRFLVANKTTNTFQLTTKSGVVVDGTALPAYVSGGTAAKPYEVVTTYAEADLFGLQFKQINDVMYIVHPEYAPRKLSRVTDTSWTFGVVAFDQAPLLDENVTDVTLTCSAATVGTLRTLTASAPMFTAGHVGAVFQISHDQNAASIELPLTVTGTSPELRVKGSWGIQTSGTWTGGLIVERKRASESSFQIIRAFTGKADRNVSASGLETEDCQLRMQFGYTSHSGTPDPRAWIEAENATVSGLVLVTAFTSSTEVTVSVVTALAATTATKFWREGAWSDYRGYPRAIGLYEQRLFFGGTASSPTRFWGSKSGDFENFEDGSLDDAGVSFVVASAESNPIMWMEGLDVLQIGTAGSEIVARAGSQDEPLTPSNVAVRAQSAYGSDIIQAVSVGDAVLFLQRQGRRVREMAYTIEKDRYVAPDLTLLSEHVTKSGILQMGFARQPDPTLMLVRADGQLAVLTYNREQNVTAWARWVTDGVFESIASVYGDPVDEIWFSVRRTVGGEAVRYIEQMAIEADAEEPGVSADTAQVVFIIDTTGSMDGIINSVKAQVEAIAALYAANFASVTFALADYKDESDPFVLTDFLPLDEFTPILEALTTSGGGDTEEDGYGAIVKSMDGVTWNTGSSRFCILFTDAPSHDRGATEAQALTALLENSVKFSYGIGTQPTFEPLRIATDGVLLDDEDDIVDGLLPSVFTPYEEFYLDCAKTNVTTDGVISRLFHLEGRTVRVVLNDAVMGDFVVTDGAITLPEGSIGAYVVGLPYQGTLKTMRLDINLANGASQGRKRRITEVAFRFNGTQGCKFGKALTGLNEIPFRAWADNPSTGVPRFTGEKIVTWPMGYSDDAVVYVVQDQPLPCTLLGLAIKHDFMGD